VSSFVDIILSALPSISIVASSSLIPSSSVINVAQVTIAISFNISFLRSQNHGALMASTFNIHLILFRTRDASASHSISSAMITISFLPLAATHSRICKISLSDDIFLSVTRIYGFSITDSMRCASVTK
jgi:hypothetical protein